MVDGSSERNVLKEPALRLKLNKGVSKRQPKQRDRNVVLCSRGKRFQAIYFQSSDPAFVVPGGFLALNG